MKIYIELIIILNIYLDFLILLSTNIVLNRNSKIKKIILGSIFGSITTIFLLTNINNYILIPIKLVIGIIMCIISFNYKSIKYTLTNIFYLYIISIILGGGLYLIKSYKYNYIILIISSLIIISIYIKLQKNYNTNYSNYSKVEITYKNKKYILTGYLDTANKLKDIYSNKYVILANLKLKITDDIIYVSYQSLNNSGVVKCIKPEKLVVNNVEFKNYLVGLMENKITIDGVQVILNSQMKGKI